MVNRQIWPDEIQPVEDLTFVPLDVTYVKVLMARIALAYILLMACALMILLFVESNAGWILLGAECVLTIAFTVNMALAR